MPPFAAGMETAPPLYESGAENVVVAVHAGTPLRYARTYPAVPAVVVARRRASVAVRDGGGGDVRPSRAAIADR